MDERLPDWTISELYEKAWDLLKKHKILWIFGAATAAVSYGGSSYHSNSSSFQNLPSSTGSTQTSISQVLGVATSTPFSDTLVHIFTSVPITLYLLLGLAIIVLMVTYFVIILIYSAWTSAALIQSIQTASRNQRPTIEDSSLKALPAIKPLIWLNVVPILVLILAAGIYFMLTILGASLSSSFIKVLMILLIVAGAVAFIIALVYLTLALIWAARKVVLDGSKAYPALKSGFEITKRKFWSSILLGIVNLVLSFIIALPLGLLFESLAGGGLDSAFSHANNIFLPAIAFIFFLAAYFVYSLVLGLLTAFKAAVWTLAYQKIRGKYDSAN